jgi:hypothetical protein
LIAFIVALTQILTNPDKSGDSIFNFAAVLFPVSPSEQKNRTAAKTLTRRTAYLLDSDNLEQLTGRVLRP